MEESPFIRAFVALPISDETRAALARLQEQARRLRLRIGWIRPENLHVTLSFLGDIERQAVQGLTAALDAAVRGIEPFSFETADVGWFGARHPTVWWAGVTPGPGAEAMSRLAATVSQAVREAGCPDDAKSVFVPHVTLGRIRPGVDVSPLMTFAETKCAKSVFGISAADRILLVQSVLSAEGPRYTVLHESVLGATGASGTSG